jgi:Sugar kinases, ribokinase family
MGSNASFFKQLWSNGHLQDEGSDFMGIITVIGSMNMDLVVRTPRIPRAGETLAGTEFHTIPGGKGANQAVAAARAGAQTFMVGCVGRDAFGKELQDSLTCARVDVSGVESLAGISTGTATILVEDGGQNRIIIVAGANGEVTPAIIEKEWSAIQKSDLILLQHEIPLETIHFTLQKAHSQNIATLLNPVTLLRVRCGSAAPGEFPGLK